MTFGDQPAAGGRPTAPHPPHRTSPAALHPTRAAPAVPGELSGTPIARFDPIAARLVWLHPSDSFRLLPTPSDSSRLLRTRRCGCPRSSSCSGRRRPPPKVQSPAISSHLPPSMTFGDALLRRRLLLLHHRRARARPRVPRPRARGHLDRVARGHLAVPHLPAGGVPEALPASDCFGLLRIASDCL